MMMKLFRILLLILLPYTVWPQTSPFNGRSLSGADSLGNYHFFISAHFHGSSNNASGLPAKTVLNNLNSINADQPLFLAHLGDLFLDVKKDIPAYSDTLLRRLNFPVFNAVGNHDLSGSVYQDQFGVTWFSMVVGREKFIFLDTEESDGSINGKQKEFLLQELKVSDSIRSVFLFAHRLIWAEEHPELKDLFTDNTRAAKPGNFRTEILPELEKLSKKHPVIIAGGSMGNVPASFFFHREKDADITYIATAIRDTPRDAMLRVDVQNGKVNYSSFPLPMDPEFYDLNYYRPQEKKSAPFNWRLVPMYTKQALTHRYFWYGILCLLFPVLVIWFLMARKRRRKYGK